MTTVEKRFSQSNKAALRNPWVLGWLAMVVVVLSVNIGFVTVAFLTNPGLVEEDYYERGKDYEQNMVSMRQMRSELGWQTQFELPVKSLVGKESSYRFSAVDKAGLPLRDAKVTLQAYRPSDSSADFYRDMIEVLPGVYEVHTAFPLKGLWDLRVTVSKDGSDLNYNRRINIAAH